MKNDGFDFWNSKYCSIESSVKVPYTFEKEIYYYKKIQIYYNIFCLTKIAHYFNLLNLYILILPFYLKS